MHFENSIKVFTAFNSTFYTEMTQQMHFQYNYTLSNTYIHIRIYPS